VRAPWNRWLLETVPAERLVFRATEPAALLAAIRAGAGIGFVAVFEAAACPDLVEVMAPRSDWAAPLWLVTHVDLHRTTKVQAFLAHLKDAARTWTDL
jgi:DNA-binding transcriptional LysR family regulator